jgi:predicted SAM-dependent methyltransferase
MWVKRQELSAQYLVGQGVEIGALHNPLWTSDKTTVRYVDRLTPGQLAEHYPELKEAHFVNVDIVDDGEILSSIADSDLDFIIANHMLEHTENPLGTVRNHLRKLRPRGVLYYAVPDKRFTFDSERSLTGFEHLVLDDRQGPQVSRHEHLREWARFVNKLTDPEEIEAQVCKLAETRYSIHFHVWDYASFREFLSLGRQYLGRPFTVEYLGENETEVIAVLRKTDSDDVVWSAR